MTDPSSTKFPPHIIGILNSGTAGANSMVVITNATNGNRLVGKTDSNKRAIFDLSNFTNGYTAGDVILIETVGADFGGTTITINSTGDFQSDTITVNTPPSAITTNLNI